QRRAWPVDDDDRRKVRDRSPVAPEMELAEIIGPHDPDEPDSPGAPREPGQRIVGIAGADMGLDVRHGDARAGYEATGGLDARLQGGEVRLRFQGVARRHQPPDAIEAEAHERNACDERVTIMRRIERTAEQADAHPRLEGRQARDSSHEADCWASSSA